MKNLTRIVTGAVALCFLAACGEKEKPVSAPGKGGDAGPPAAAEPAAPKPPKREALEGEMGRLMQQFGEVVSIVADRPSWELAKREVTRIEARAVAITAELKALPAPTPEQLQASLKVMKENEDKLEEILGDKDAFIGGLPQDVGQELMQAAGSFSMKMGQAQNALYGRSKP